MVVAAAEADVRGENTRPGLYGIETPSVCPQPGAGSAVRIRDRAYTGLKRNRSPRIP